MTLKLPWSPQSQRWKNQLHSLIFIPLRHSLVPAHYNRTIVLSANSPYPKALTENEIAQIIPFNKNINLMYWKIRYTSIFFFDAEIRRYPWNRVIAIYIHGVHPTYQYTPPIWSMFIVPKASEKRTKRAFLRSALKTTHLPIASKSPFFLNKIVISSKTHLI